MVKKGSFTVEASLVVPFLCFLLAVFLQTILYLHDISIFSAAAYEAAQKGAALKNCSQVEREDYAKETAEKLLENRRMACSIYAVTVQADFRCVCVTICGNTGFLHGMEWTVKKEAVCVNAVDYLRNRKIREKIKEGTG